MGFLDLFKKKKSKEKYYIADYIDGRYPWYSQFGTDVYASDVVQQAVFSIVNELIKLDIVHVRKNGNGEDVPVSGNIQSVLDNPNPLMTAVDYKSKMFWNLLLNYNAFAYPIWEGNNLKAIYPLQPSYVEWNKDPLGDLYVNFKFASGYEITLPYSDIIHIRYKYSVSEFMGGNSEGQPDNKALLETLKLNDTLLKGLAKSLKMQTSVNAVIKMKTMANVEAQKQAIKDFESKLENNESGVLPIDITGEFMPINKQIQLLDATTLEFIDKKILRWFGVSAAIVNGDFSKDQYEAFYQKTLEPIIKASIEAHTKGLFSNKASFGFGNKIMFYTAQLIFLSSSQKIEAANLLVDSGSCYKNELRTMLGLRPLKELEGQLAESSNKTNAENNKTDNNTSTDNDTDEEGDLDE